MKTKDKTLLFIVLMIIPAGLIINKVIHWKDPVTYNNECSNCKLVWVEDTEREINNCPRCPLDICMVSAGLIISLGTLNEIVIHQPDNEKALENKLRCERLLKLHLDVCPKCRYELGYEDKPCDEREDKREE